MKYEEQSCIYTWKNGEREAQILVTRRAKRALETTGGSTEEKVAGCFLYILTIKGRVRYFGITRSPKTRLSTHMSELSASTHKNFALKKAFRDKAKVAMIVVKECESVELAEALEARLIRFFRTAFKLCNASKIKPEHKTIAKYGRYQTEKRQRASARGTRMANARWAKDRAMRDMMAALDPIKFEGRIIRRIIVIDGEAKAREIIFYDFDNYTDRRRKLREARALAEFPKTHVDSANATL